MRVDCTRDDQGRCNRSTEDFCRTFDLTCRIPDATISAARTEGRFIEVKPDEAIPDVSSSCRRVLRRLSEILSAADADASSPVATRICIPALGSYEWGDLSPPVRLLKLAAYTMFDSQSQDVCYFLHSLRALLRRHPRACAAVCMPSHLCQEAFGGAGWVQKLGWLSDASITLAAFTGQSLCLASMT